MPLPLFVPLAEAAFIAGLNDRQMNRMVDEHLIPSALLGRDDHVRSFSRLSAAFARFYFDTEATLLAGARRDIVEEVTARVRRSKGARDLLALRALPPGFDWKVARPAIEIDLLPFVADSYARAREVDAAQASVSEDPEIMGGLPCFTGTRVPIEIVLGSLDEGEAFEEVRASYPFVTEELVAAARTYAAVRPRRGRPRKDSSARAGWTLIKRTIIRPGVA